jgi:[amino group carrier protein]-lysine/ornithine hydrolase
LKSANREITEGLSPLSEKISNAQAEDLLMNLVATPSPSQREYDAAHFLTRWMAAHGYDRAFIDEAGNAVGIIGQGERDVLLLGHIDTFGGNPPVRLEERLLYGRGAVDAKGALCTFAVAAARAALPPDVRLIVVGAVEEEASTSKGARFITSQYQPEMCIIGEPSNWDRITLGYKGRLVLSWQWEGGLGHSAGQAATPAERAFAYWQSVQAYVETFNEAKTRVFDRLDTALQDLNTGHDGIHGWAAMTIGFRLPVGVEPKILWAALNVAPTDTGVTIQAYGMEHAFVGEKDTALSRALRGAIRAEGGTPAFVHKTGTSDMNIVGRVWHCPIVAYGPGDSALDHTPDEHLDLDEYLRAIRVLQTALERI